MITMGLGSYTGTICYLPHFNYILCSWGFYSDDLYTLQKKAVCVVANSPYITHTDLIFNTYTLIKIHDLHVNYLKSYKLFYHLYNKSFTVILYIQT